MVALSDGGQVFTWGRRMGIYPEIELTPSNLIKRGNAYASNEINSGSPRLIKNNLIYHKIAKIYSSYFNTALVTDKGELLLQGSNEGGQLAFPKEISDHLKFFAEFRTIDALKGYEVTDLALSLSTIHVLCVSKDTGAREVFGWGFNENY